MAPRLNDRQRLNWLRLIRTQNVGPASFRHLINKYGSAEAAIEILPQLASQGGARGQLRITSVADAEKELDGIARIGARIVAIGESGYPAMLANVEFPPPLLTVMGDTGIFDKPSVSMVGARNASLSGINFARKLSAEIGRKGWVVTSGLARGIDAAAHQGALETGTVAVMAGGIDRPYPQQNIPLMNEIVENGGAIICEMPLGWEPRAKDFPRRNRIVAGLSLGLVVVEAATRSGSLISARMANEMGRVVFAVPGSPLDPRAEGANRLLKQGAILVTDADDVVEHLSPMLQRDLFAAPRLDDETLPVADELSPRNDDDRERLVSLLGPTPVGIDDLIAHSGISPAGVQMILLELDLAGRLDRHAGAKVSLVFQN